MSDRGRITKPTLAELQARLWTAITTRESLPEGLHGLGLHAAYLDGFVAGDDRLDAVGRVDIYNGMYFLRILDSLKEDYTAVLAVLGDDDFYDLAADYLQAHPSEKPNLRNASERMPAFLRDWAATHGRPAWLADLAALEWAMVDVFDEADDTALTLADVQALDPEALPDLSLRIVRAHRRLSLPHAVSPVWRALEIDHRPADELTAPAVGATEVLVWRRALAVTQRELPADERPLMDLLGAGTTFGLLCEALGAAHDEEQAATLAAQHLLRWVDQGLLVAPEGLSATTRNQSRNP